SNTHGYLFNHLANTNLKLQRFPVESVAWLSLRDVPLLLSNCLSFCPFSRYISPHPARLLPAFFPTWNLVNIPLMRPPPARTVAQVRAHSRTRKKNISSATWMTIWLQAHLVLMARKANGLN